MESLNISKLQLSSVRNEKPTENRTNEKSNDIDEENILMEEDPLNCEYRDEIWKTLLEQEEEKPTFHLQSPQLEFRGALVVQLREVSQKLNLSLASLHAAVALLDLFMDAHRLRSDRLSHVALACLSLAAKSEEKFNCAPTLKMLSKISGVQLCSKTFRQLEWLIGQHVKWKLLAPTPVTFAAMIAHCVVLDKDLKSKNPKFIKRIKRDGAKMLEAYLDLTLSDVRLKAVSGVEVALACVMASRVALGFEPWPDVLEVHAPAQRVQPVARLLQRMMAKLQNNVNQSEIESDLGYSSARTSPILTPCTSRTTSPASTTSIDTEDNRSRMIDGGSRLIDVRAIKRHLDPSEFESKRCRFSSQMTRVTL